MVRVENLSFSYDKARVLSNVSFDVASNSWLTIMGMNGSGKSSLLKLLCGLYYGIGDIFIEDEKLSHRNVNDLRKKIGVLFLNVDNMFVRETVYDEISFALINLGLAMKEVDLKVNNILKVLSLLKFKDEKLTDLNKSKKTLVAFASVLIYNPCILFIDEVFTNLYNDDLELVVDYIKGNNITVINCTNNSNEILYGDSLLILDAGKVISNCLVSSILSDEDFFEDNNIEMPFVLAISKKLKYYDLVDKPFVGTEDLVDKLWS